MCVCLRESVCVCFCVLVRRGGKNGIKFLHLASHAVAQSGSGFPARHGNAVIKPACKTSAVQSTHAFWGLYLETRKEHFTVSSHRVESKLLPAGLFLPFQVRIRLQKTHSSSESVRSSCVKTLALQIGITHRSKREPAAVFLCTSLR